MPTNLLRSPLLVFGEAENEEGVGGGDLRNTEPIEIHYIHLDTEEQPDLLTNAELTRADAFSTQTLRRRFVVRRGRLRLLLGARLGIAPQKVPIEIDGHGKPFLPDNPLYFSASSRNEHGLIALSMTSHVGVDIERVPEALDPSLLQDVLGEPERRLLGESQDAQELFTLAWVGKEAVAKALGVGLGLPFDRLCVLEESGLRRSVTWGVNLGLAEVLLDEENSGGLHPQPPPHFRLRQKRGGGTGFYAAVSWRG